MLPSPDLNRFHAAGLAARAAAPRGSEFGPNTAPRVLDHGEGADRRIVVFTSAGLVVELLPGHGLDIGRVSYLGMPISWGTPADARYPTAGDDIGAGPDVGAGADWLRRWTGGLVTTCGLRNVGAAGHGYGLHGDYIFRAARAVTIRHHGAPDAPAVVVSGTVYDGRALHSEIEHRRSIVIADDHLQIHLRDETTNRGPHPEVLPLLYHANLGSPFLTPDCVVRGVGDLTPRDPQSAWTHGWPRMGLEEPGETELVAQAHLDEAGFAQVINEAAGALFEMRWSARTLPRFHVWRRRRADAYVLALEPANCEQLGRRQTEEGQDPPIVPPGGTRTTTLSLALLPTDFQES